MKKLLCGFICFFFGLVLWEHYERTVKIDNEYDIDYKKEYSEELSLFFKDHYSLSKEYHYEYPGEPCWEYTLYYDDSYYTMYSDISFSSQLLNIYQSYFLDCLNIDLGDILQCYLEKSRHPVDYHYINLYTKPTDQIFLKKMMIVKIEVKSLESRQFILQQFTHFTGSIRVDDKDYYYVQGQRCTKSFFSKYTDYNEKP